MPLTERKDLEVLHSGDFYLGDEVTIEDIGARHLRLYVKKADGAEFIRVISVHEWNKLIEDPKWSGADIHVFDVFKHNGQSFRHVPILDL